ncbi:MAG TPA: hypothetical protein VFW26_06735 [Gaiellales bacterium]|nr:hypothetical protein [Gaiellales bacterium]
MQVRNTGNTFFNIIKGDTTFSTKFAAAYHPPAPDPRGRGADGHGHFAARRAPAPPRRRAQERQGGGTVAMGLVRIRYMSVP